MSATNIIPDNAISKGFLSEILKPRDSIGIILERISHNQITFDVVSSVNNFLPNKVEAVIFAETSGSMITLPRTGIYHLTHAVEYRGHIISTSVPGLVDAVRLPHVKKIMWYIYSPHEMQMYQPEEINMLMHSPRIIKVCRSVEHIQMYNSVFPEAEIHQTPIDNFDLDELSKILFRRDS